MSNEALVKQLRKLAPICRGQAEIYIEKAADEIERLERLLAENAELRKDAERRWVGLTDDEVLDIVGRAGAGYPAVVPPYTRDLFKKIEDKLKEKNE
jgi:hypothetical protein